jgi:excisionase family DNA binding protein
MAPDKLLRVEEVADRLGIKPATVRAKILGRIWPFVRIGRSVRIKESVILRLIEDNGVPARAARR